MESEESSLGINLSQPPDLSIIDIYIMAGSKRKKLSSPSSPSDQMDSSTQASQQGPSSARYSAGGPQQSSSSRLPVQPEHDAAQASRTSRRPPVPTTSSRPTVSADDTYLSQTYQGPSIPHPHNARSQQTTRLHSSPQGPLQGLQTALNPRLTLDHPLLHQATVQLLGLIPPRIRPVGWVHTPAILTAATEYILELQGSQAEIGAYVELERTYRELYRSHEELRTACGELQRSHAELQRADEERQRAHGELQESHAQLETAYEEIDRSITDQANEIQLVATEIEALSELNSRLPVPRWQTKITLAPNDPGCGHFPPIAELGARLTQLERQYRDIGAQSPPTGSCHSHTAMITFLTAIIVRLENGLLELGHDEGSGPSGATGD